MEPLRPSDPREIGSYRLIGRLGAGGMGQVFLGRSLGGRPVVVKVIAAGLSADPDFRRRFALEVDAARRVGGFFTAQIVDANPDASPPWLVAAYVPGPSLQEAVDTCGPLPVETVRALGAGLAEGLTAIHACGLVHRDLKPGNVILSDDGPRVIDFGIARSLESNHTMTAVGSVIGTPGFMSPEQAQGERNIGPESDVFSLGSVLAFAATGHGPYGEGSAPMLVYKIMSQEPDLSRVPDALRPIIAACQAKRPADRPTVAEVQQYFGDVASSDTHWLPHAVSAMVAERVSWVSGGKTTPAAEHAQTPEVQSPPAQPSPVQTPDMTLPSTMATPGFTAPPPAFTPPPQGYGPTMPGYGPHFPGHTPRPAPAKSGRGPVLAAVIAVAAVVVLGLAVLGIYVATNGPAPAPNPSAAAALNGLWRGSYVCNQGPTSLQLTITSSGSGDAVQATFNFFSTPDNTVPTGSYAMKGTFSGGTLTLHGDHWIQQPQGYYMVGLSANVQGTNPTSLNGKVVDDRGGCTTFSLQRDNG